LVLFFFSKDISLNNIQSLKIAKILYLNPHLIFKLNHFSSQKSAINCIRSHVF
jgi:hypothetical protein